MTHKIDHSAYIAIAVAPMSIGSKALKDALKAACVQANLTQTAAPVRTLGSTRKWAAVEIDVILKKTHLKTARETLQTCLGSDIDTALIPSQNRQKQVLVCDMDSTIIEQECLDELAAYAGLKSEIAAITARAMQGALDFEEALTERVGKLSGLSLDALEKCYSERISLMPGAKTLIKTMRSKGAHCILVSGGFTYFTARVAALTGFHAHRGNTLLDNGKTLTGKVAYPILGRNAKLDALDETAATHHLARTDCLAIGDGANDLAMIEAAGLGLAVHAKPIVAAASDAAINATDLIAALYFQGYTDNQIIWCE